LTPTYKGYLTGIKAISKTPGLYWLDPFFVSRPSLIVKRFVYLASDQVRLSIWQMALSTAVRDPVGRLQRDRCRGTGRCFRHVSALV
jgi:hypothetical protein